MRGEEGGLGTRGGVENAFQAWLGRSSTRRTLGHPPPPKLEVILGSPGNLPCVVKERFPRTPDRALPRSTLYCWFSTLVSVEL